MGEINNDSGISFQYLDALIADIQKKIELSLKEFSKTNLTCGTNIDALNLWYEQLILLVKKNPPESYVIKLIAYQKEAEILSIRYIYSESNKAPESVLISIDDV